MWQFFFFISGFVRQQIVTYGCDVSLPGDLVRVCVTEPPRLCRAVRVFLCSQQWVHITCGAESQPGSAGVMMLLMVTSFLPVVKLNNTLRNPTELN